jgi:hypothetical protein
MQQLASSILNILNPWIAKLDNFIAVCANEMVMLP